MSLAVMSELNEGFDFNKEFNKINKKGVGNFRFYEGFDFFLKDELFYCDVYSFLLGKDSEVLRFWKLHPEQMHFEIFAKRYCEAFYVQDVSANPSGNVNGKTLARFKVEMVHYLLRYLTFKVLYEKMVSMYGRDLARDLAFKLLNGTFYLHDTSSYICGYCLGVDFSRLILEGMPYGHLKSLPPRKPRTFINQVKEVVIELSNEFAGAIAFPTLILLYAYVYLKYYGGGCEINRKEIEDDFQNLVHTINKEMRSGIESPFTNLSFFDRFILREMATYVYPHFVSEVGGVDYFVSVVYEIQKIVMEYLCKGDPITGGPYRFPVLTANFLKDRKTGEILDREFLDLVSRNNTRGQMNIYVAEDARKYSLCCRFQPDYVNLKFDSFGNGGVNIGSIKVLTINLNRVALETVIELGEGVNGSGREAKFFEKLEKRVREARMILDAYRECLREHINMGWFKFFNMGWFDLDKHFFSTIGFIGFWEAMETLGYSVMDSIGEETLRRLDEMIQGFNSEGLLWKYNLEQIPGEAAAVLLAKIDRYYYGEKRVPYVLYANQFIPLYVKHTLFDKIDVEGRFFKYLSGGGISHINILHELSPEEVKFIISLCVRKGIEHFALNPVYSVCQEGHYILGKVNMCPDCGNVIKDYVTRVVGFFVPVSSWIKERREYEFERREFFVLKDWSKI